MNIGERIRVETPPAEEAFHSESHELSIADAIAFLRYYWPLVAATALGAIALAVVYVATAAPIYTSSAQLLIETAQQSAPTITMSESVVALDTPQIESEIALLSSEQIIRKAVDILDSASDSKAPAAANPAGTAASAPDKGGVIAAPQPPAQSSWLYRLIFGEPAKSTKEEKEARIRNQISQIQQGLDVRRMGLSYVLVLSYRSGDPVRAAAVVNALGDAYVRDKIDRRTEAARQSGIWLESRIEEIRHLMNEAALDVQAFKAKRDYSLTQRPETGENSGPLGLEGELGGGADAKAPNANKDQRGSFKPQTSPQEAPTLEELDSRALTYRKIYESYLQAYTDTVQRQSYPSTNARVIARGEVPTTKSGPRRTLALIGSAVLGSLMGFALALVHLNFDHTVRSGRQIWQNIKAPLLGDVDQIAALKHFSLQRLLGASVGIAPRSSSAHPIVEFKPSSHSATQLAEAALAVQEAAHVRGVNVVGFVDTGSGSTSATMCSNLALLNARAGKRTLLIETDPAMETVPSLPGATGYSLIDVINGGVDVEAAAIPSKFESNLYLLNIGNSADRRFWTTENVTAFRALREQFTRRYDTIFVHLPPIKSNHLTLTVDAVVIVTAKRVTTVSELLDATTLLRIAEKPVLGVIISGLA